MRGPFELRNALSPRQNLQKRKSRTLFFVELFIPLLDYTFTWRILYLVGLYPILNWKFPPNIGLNIHCSISINKPAPCFPTLPYTCSNFLPLLRMVASLVLFKRIYWNF